MLKIMKSPGYNTVAYAENNEILHHLTCYKVQNVQKLKMRFIESNRFIEKTS
jgi:tRNA A37 threonylcarbamoyladenosine biosynthesis protein TsaE